MFKGIIASLINEAFIKCSFFADILLLMSWFHRCFRATDNVITSSKETFQCRDWDKTFRFSFVVSWRHVAWRWLKASLQDRKFSSKLLSLRLYTCIDGNKLSYQISLVFVYASDGSMKEKKEWRSSPNRVWLRLILCFLLFVFFFLKCNLVWLLSDWV